MPTPYNGSTSDAPRIVAGAGALERTPEALLYPPSEYDRSTYAVQRLEVVAPSVRNDGAPSGYRDATRAVLRQYFSGWTEHETTGYWLGKLEAGTTFVVYAEPRLVKMLCAALAHDLRGAMPDQDAIQLVIGARVELREA